MKKYLYGSAFALVALVYCVPGESIVQLGLRKIALEQGVQQARQTWDFMASPRADAAPIAAEPVKQGPKKVAKR